MFIHSNTDDGICGENGEFLLQRRPTANPHRSRHPLARIRTTLWPDQPRNAARVRAAAHRAEARRAWTLTNRQLCPEVSRSQVFILISLMTLAAPANAADAAWNVPQPPHEMRDAVRVVSALDAGGFPKRRAVRGLVGAVVREFDVAGARRRRGRRARFRGGPFAPVRA